MVTTIHGAVDDLAKDLRLSLQRSPSAIHLLEVVVVGVSHLGCDGVARGEVEYDQIATLYLSDAFEALVG